MANDSAKIEQITPSLSLEWSHEGRILIWAWKDNTRETMDAFATAMRSIVQQWDPAKPLLQLYDQTYDNAGYTRYVSEKAQTILHDIHQRGIKGQTAVVLRKSRLTDLTGMITRGLTTVYPRFDIRVFDNQNDALGWLEQKLD